MKNITLGSTGITAPQNGFGALPIQRDDMETTIHILRKAYDGGMRFFDTARAYTDSEEKLGKGLMEYGVRDNIYIATKTAAKDPEYFWKDLETSLKLLQTDHVDIYQFHMVSQCYRPGDGTGMYECMMEAKEKGLIRHIGITTHKLMVAEEIIESGLYETLQYPFSYLSTDKEIELVNKCKDHNMGFIAMKGLAGGLINKSDAAFAFMSQFDNVMPIWGIQREKELDEWLSYMDESPVLTDSIKEFIAQEKNELSGDFCRGCGYCMPCPKGILINNCARMSLMIRRAPSDSWLDEHWQKEMAKIDDCINCRACTKKCPYELSTPELLKKNYEDYKNVLAGKVSVR